MGRFINADVFVSTGTGLLGNNMFAYCNSNPIRFSDPTGHAIWGTNTVAIKDGSSGFTPGSAKYITQILSRTTMADVRESFVRVLELMRKPSSGGGTFSAGVTASSIHDDRGLGWSGVISADTEFNYAIQQSNSLLAATGGGDSAGVVLTWTNARKVSDLTGDSSMYGFTIAGPFGVAIDWISFVPASEPDTKKYGISVAILYGAGADIHTGSTITSPVSPTWNPITAIINKINGG